MVRVNRFPRAGVPVKFFGGLLAMGCGLAFGRDGPTAPGLLASRFLTKGDENVKVIAAEGAAAGIAALFTASIGGSVFAIATGMSGGAVIM